MVFEDLVEARLLVALSEAPSFAQAGRAIGMPAATVTRRIATLEKRAGLRLFDRTSRAVRATAAGQALMGHAQHLLDEADRAVMSMETLRDVPNGWIRVTAPVMLGEALMGPIIASFIDRHPDANVFLDLSSDAIDLVAEGFDVAIRTGALTDGDLIGRKVGQAGAALYRSTRSKAPISETPDDLAGLPFGLLRRAGKPEDRVAVFDRNGDRDFITARSRIVSLNAQVLLQTALETDLVVVLPRMVAYPAVISGRLRRELPNYSAHDTDVSIVHTSRRLMRSIVRLFVDHVALELPSRLKRFEGDGV